MGRAEEQSIEAAGDDDDWVNQIREFWDQHLPIAVSVEDGYAYYALRSDLAVVFGREPEYEETSLFAPTYKIFLEKLAASLRRMR